jgi:hypothetical protein
MSADEIEMNKAVLASVQTSSNGATPTIAPVQRRRDGLLPVGLKNVGNTWLVICCCRCCRCCCLRTCVGSYLNSLIQAYYGVASLRRAVLSIPASAYVDLPPFGSSVVKRDGASQPSSSASASSSSTTTTTNVGVADKAAKVLGVDQSGRCCAV